MSAISGEKIAMIKKILVEDSPVDIAVDHTFVTVYVVNEFSNSISAIAAKNNAMQSAFA